MEHLRNGTVNNLKDGTYNKEHLINGTINSLKSGTYNI